MNVGNVLNTGNFSKISNGNFLDNLIGEGLIISHHRYVLICRAVFCFGLKMDVDKAVIRRFRVFPV